MNHHNKQPLATNTLFKIAPEAVATLLDCFADVEPASVAEVANYFGYTLGRLTAAREPPHGWEAVAFLVFVEECLHSLVEISPATAEAPFYEVFSEGDVVGIALDAPALPPDLVQGVFPLVHRKMQDVGNVAVNFTYASLGGSKHRVWVETSFAAELVRVDNPLRVGSPDAVLAFSGALLAARAGVIQPGLGSQFCCDRI